MKKKCIPGVICIENLTLFSVLLMCIGIGFLYFYFNYKITLLSNAHANVHRNTYDLASHRAYGSSAFPYTVDVSRTEEGQINPHYLAGSVTGMNAGISTRNMPFNDPYAPPLKSTSTILYPSDSSDIRGIPSVAQVPISVKTQMGNTSYQQIGILTRTNQKEDMILPIFGRKTVQRRDKWNYYTISNTGPISTKLPISVRGKSCTNDLGCDEIYNGDTVFVEGYKDTFVATIYENGGMSYIPVL